MSMLDRIRDGFKYLDKNGLKHLIEKIKLHDVHWTGTHAEYEAVKDTIPAYAILHFTDDYDDGYGAPFSRSYINTGAPAYGDVTLASTNVYDAVEELMRSWKTKSDAERRAFACTGLITLTNNDGDTRLPYLCGTYLLTTQRGIDTGTNYFVRLEIWQNTGDFAVGGQIILNASLTQLGIFNCDYSYINQPYSTSEIPTGTRWIDGKPIYRRVFTNLPISSAWSQHTVDNSSQDSLVSYAILGKSGVSGDTHTTPYFDGASDYFQVAVVVGAGSLNYWGAASSINAFDMVVEYTKTTD